MARVNTYGMLSGFDGNRPVDLTNRGSGDGRVRTPGPGRAPDSNAKNATKIMGMLMSWSFDANALAGALLAGMETPLQKRLAALVFRLIRLWADMADVSDQYGPTHPMYEENRQARAMLRGMPRDN